MSDLKAILRNLPIIKAGTFTVSSATVPADTARTEGDDFCKGCLIMPVEGAAAFQPRPISAFTSGTDVFTLGEPFTVAPGLVGYVILAAGVSVQQLQDIFDLVNAILVLQETGGTLTADGTEQDLFIIDAPGASIKPADLYIDLDNMTTVDADAVTIREYYRIADGGAWRLLDANSYAGDDGGLTDGRVMILVELSHTRYGVRVTLEQTAGVNKDFPWEPFVYR
jgi:hypothetical protein